MDEMYNAAEQSILVLGAINGIGFFISLTAAILLGIFLFQKTTVNSWFDDEVVSLILCTLFVISLLGLPIFFYNAMNYLFATEWYAIERLMSLYG